MYMYVYMCVHVCLYMCMCICICMYMYICVSVYMYANTCISTRVRVYICTRAGAFGLFVLSNPSTTCACITGAFQHFHACVEGDWKWGFFQACSWLALVAGVGGYVLTGVEIDLTCKRGSVGQSEGLSIPRSSVRFRLKPDNSISDEFELHRPSNKGTKLLLKVIKAIIIIRGFV